MENECNGCGHTYDYANGGVKSLFCVSVPNGETSENMRLFSYSIVSIDIVWNLLLLRCKNPVIINKKHEGSWFLSMEWRTFDTKSVCGSYDEPLKIMDVSRTGDIVRTHVFEKPKITFFGESYGTDADVVYCVKYACRYTEENQ